jgi:hypothetical protein
MYLTLTKPLAFSGMVFSFVVTSCGSVGSQ